MTYKIDKNLRRLRVPTIFPLEPEDCDHKLHWYVTPEKNICGTCGTNLPKPNNHGVITTRSMTMAELTARRWA